MAPPKVTDYERKRLENIRRNNEMMEALKLQSKASQLSNHTQVLVTKSEKKPKIETPILLRRSPRTIGGVSSDSGKKKEVRDKVEFKTKSEVEIVDDGFKWRKYGQKMVKNSPNPR
ncbi:hypothetical protein TSUD_315020 [Trifolium subterraneum]|uniref:WRKY domain-containing protein n=1 Tax=Trifolium subterraneum TaxID=3900 RepID=A0A2Z6MSV8_TRISU|nr:hypothetical protein TSUD_315020 [Trifolium subterraneum]